MSPSQYTRTSRKREVPRAFILNWQCPGTRDPKPLVRRPMTACETCRIAKVKCNGQQECDRCTSRGIYCRYTYANSQNLDVSQQSPPRTSTGAPPPRTQPQTTPEEMTMDLNIDAASPFCMDNMAYEQSYGTVVDWPQEAVSQRVEPSDWSPLDINLNNQTFDFSTTHSSPTDWDLFQSLLKTTPQYNLTQTTQPPHNDSHSASSASMSPPSSLSLQDELSSGNNCQCRSSLMLLVPKVKSAMQERPKPRLDGVFQVTGDVIRSCQDMINCASCQVSCTDLVCILAVFQQTDTCFEYIAKVDPAAGAMKVSVGEYEVSIVNDVKLRRMLVMDLVKQANTVLDSLSSLGQNMFPTYSAMPCRLSLINLDYLQKITENFKMILRSITDSFDEIGCDSVGMLRELGLGHQTNVEDDPVDFGI